MCFYRLLGLDLVVRDDHGNILDPLKTSTVSLFRQVSDYMVPTWTENPGKIGNHFPVREFEQTAQARELYYQNTGKVRDFYPKYWTSEGILAFLFVFFPLFF